MQPINQSIKSEVCSGSSTDPSDYLYVCPPLCMFAYLSTVGKPHQPQSRTLLGRCCWSPNPLTSSFLWRGRWGFVNMLIEVFEIFSVLHPSLLIASTWRKALQCKHMPFMPMAAFKRVARDQQIGARLG